MRKSIKRVAVGGGIVVVLTVGMLGVGVYRQISPPLSAPLTSLAPISIHDASGVSQPLGSRFHPSAMTIVGFWASWCVPCRAEAVTLARLARRYPPNLLNIVYLNVEDEPDKSAASAFMNRANAGNLSLLFGGKAAWRSVTGSRTIVLPRTYIFDALGRSTAVLTGYGPASTDELSAKVDAVKAAGQRSVPI